MHGYSQRIVDFARSADPSKWGVRLGLFCIDNNVSVTKVADEFNVSRMTVYNWFTGKTDPLPAQKRRIQEYLGANSTNADTDVSGARTTLDGDVVSGGHQERTGQALLPLGKE